MPGPIDSTTIDEPAIEEPAVGESSDVLADVVGLVIGAWLTKRAAAQ